MPAPMRTASELAAAGRALAAPFQVELRVIGAFVIPAAPPLPREGQPGYLGALVTGVADEPPVEPLLKSAPADRIGVHCERVLRLLPGRRLVAQGRVGDSTVLLKLFMGRGSVRYADREANGSRLLDRAGVPAPRLLGRAQTPDGAAHALLYEFLNDVRPVEAHDTAGIAAAAAALARLHAAGCRHTDLHLGNVLLAAPGGAGLRLVDADGIRRGVLAVLGAGGLGPRASVRNLAVLCAQRPPDCDADLEAIHRAYATARGWQAAPVGCSLAALRAATRRERRERAERYLRKTVRPCSEYHVERDLRGTRICVREFWEPAMQQFFADPEAGMRNGAMLKDGNSATVMRTAIGGHVWIVKRYNVKGLWHRVRRSLKPRARHRNAWRNGQRLHFAGIPTARPVALLEQRFGPVRGVAYLVMQDLGDRDLLGVARAVEPDDAVISAVAGLFRALDALGLTHGDTKATNFLLADGGVALVDLDSMQAHARGWARRAARDRERFLANWDDAPALRQRFAKAFRDAGLVGRAVPVSTGGAPPAAGS